MSDPREFLSRTGYRLVTATTNANLTGVITSVGNATSVGSLTTALIPEVTNLYFTDERAQDAVGTILTDTATIDFTYTDATPTITADLKNTTVSAGTYGSSTQVGTFTVDAQGRLTAASNVAISGFVSSTLTNTHIFVGNAGNVATDVALSGDATLANTGALTLANTAVAAGSYGSASSVGTFTVDSKGRLTAASNAAISITSTAITDFTEAAQDATGAMVDSTLVYVDATPLLTRAALTGDITAPQASNATTLATVNSNVGTFGTASNVGTFTVNAKGLITAAANTAIAITSSQVTDFNEAAQDAVGGILTDTATIDFTYSDAGNTITADLKNTTVTPGTYTDATITVDAQGRLTAASTGIMFTSSDQTITSGGALTLAHGLGAVPHNIRAFLVCQIANLNYSPGDITPVDFHSGNNRGFAVTPDATNLVIRFGSSVPVFTIVNKTTGSTDDITAANWKIRFYAKVNL